MNPPNGHADGSAGTDHPSAPPAMTSTPGLFNPDRIKQFVALLEVPFDPLVIEWRVTNTSKGKVNGNLRGQVIPYADQRAYTDRLNALFSPAGWTRKYSVHTSANFQRDSDQRTTAKVFVTCDLTIFGLGSHSATGEEWADDENAGTSAEAQASNVRVLALGLAATCTTSRVSGWTWMTENGLRQSRNSSAGRRLTAGDKAFDPTRNSRRRKTQARRSQMRSGPPRRARLRRCHLSAQSLFARSKAWLSRSGNAFIGDC